MNRRDMLLGLILITVLAGVPARADDAVKPSGVTGAWKWSQTRPDGTVVPITLTLKQDGEKVTGTLHGQGPDRTYERNGVKILLRAGN